MRVPRLFFFTLLPLSVLSQGFSPYTGYTLSTRIPWSDLTSGIHNFNTVPHARIQFSNPASSPPWYNASTYTFYVDTGTCGIVTNGSKGMRPRSTPTAASLPTPSITLLIVSVMIVNLLSTEKTIGNRGHQFLSSSHTLYTGWWVTRQVSFTDAPQRVNATVKVLAIDVKYTNCNDWTPADGDVCPGGGGTPSDASETQILGIGIGRTYDGQPDGTPDKNPLLSLKYIGPTNLATASTFYPGWRIDQHGITVGLTPTVWGEAMAGFEVKLNNAPGVTPPSAGTYNPNYPWPEPRGCVAFAPSSVAGCTEVEGLLLDTGLDYASIRMPETTAKAVRDASKHLLDGKVATIRAGGTTGTPEFTELEHFQYGPESPSATCDVTPVYAQVIYDGAPVATRKRNFVNTGRHVYRRWAFGFDPWRGVVGFENHAGPCV